MAPMPSALPDMPAVPASVVTTPPAVILRMVWFLLVGDVHIAGAIDRHAGRKVEARRGAHAVRAATHTRGAGQRGHDPAGGDLVDSVVELIGDVDVAGAVNRYTEGAVETRGGAGSIPISSATDVAREKLEVVRGRPSIARCTVVHRSIAIHLEAPIGAESHTRSLPGRRRLDSTIHIPSFISSFLIVTSPKALSRARVVARSELSRRCGSGRRRDDLHARAGCGANVAGAQVQPHRDSACGEPADRERLGEVAVRGRRDTTVT
jgi:hypothetical protein